MRYTVCFVRTGWMTDTTAAIWLGRRCLAGMPGCFITLHEHWSGNINQAGVSRRVRCVRTHRATPTVHDFIWESLGALSAGSRCPPTYRGCLTDRSRAVSQLSHLHHNISRGTSRARVGQRCSVSTPRELWANALLVGKQTKISDMHTNLPPQRWSTS